MHGIYRDSMYSLSISPTLFSHHSAFYTSLNIVIHHLQIHLYLLFIIILLIHLGSPYPSSQHISRVSSIFLPTLPYTNYPYVGNCTLDSVADAPSSFSLDGIVMECSPGTRWNQTLCTCVYVTPR